MYIPVVISIFRHVYFFKNRQQAKAKNYIGGKARIHNILLIKTV